MAGKSLLVFDSVFADAGSRFPKVISWSAPTFVGQLDGPEGGSRAKTPSAIAALARLGVEGTPAQAVRPGPCPAGLPRPLLGAA